MTLSVFFFNDTATTEIYTLSLHDALPIFLQHQHDGVADIAEGGREDVDDALGADARAADIDPVLADARAAPAQDRKSTRLNSSHANISYAVFCLKKKKNSTANSFIYSTQR